MATVRVKGFTVVRDALGSSAVEIEVDQPETVKGTLDALLRNYGPLKKILVDPSTGEMAPFLIVLNGEVISSTLDMDRPVKNGDELVIIFPIGGG
ncbi:MAG TPA: MoaD/ThiS family protein [Candidatus Methylomirabilis sp.]|nr:MoaD/ThiS family protein [Candidatus Methylomirabilis sp.]HSB77908.1 MoaD/ThiS family protein [Candidatus Methylomirabilis sp.]HSC70558.1 MoaD/ThiS family protein [Candidatus Methylomirabilis sp.]